MKKYILLAIIIVIIAAVSIFAFLTTKNNPTSSEKSVVEQVADALGKKFDKQANNVKVEVTSGTGSFAKGTYSFTDQLGGGGLWFAAKTANGWELASAGNGIVPCAEINEYNFPKDLAPQCLDTANNNNLIQR